jgi:hypothetical protein
MMKNLFKILFAGMIIISVSCGTDNLDLVPLDQGSVDGFFTSESDVVAGVNGVYETFTGSWWGGAFVHVQPHFESVTENAIICCPWEYQYKRIAQGSMTPATGGVLAWKWDYGYRAIFRVNSILEVIASGDVELSAEAAAKLEAELRFLRGYVYNELTLLYGDVPLVQSVLSPDEAKELTRDPKQTVVSFMYADLDFAIANLETSPYRGEWGRPTKQAALALKGRAQMYNSDFSGAISTLAQVIALEGSATYLDPDYESLFRGANEQSPEILFALQYVDNETGSGEGNFLGAHYGPNELAGTTASEGQGWSAFQYTQFLVDEYHMTDGLPFDQSPLYDPDNPFENRDSRFTGTFFYPGTVFRGVTLEAKHFNSNGTKKSINIASRKWKNETSINSFTNNGAEDLVLLRYADVLLMYAEAVNEVSGPTSDVYESVNKILARAGQPNLSEGMTQDEMRTRIKHEREVEFFLEGTRYFDLLRWRDAEEVLLQVTSGEQRVFNPSTHYLWPIPQFVLDQNPGITQNPGY